MHRFHATAPFGVADLLAAELAALGVERPRASPGGVHFQGSLEQGYAALLRSRVASRVILELARGRAASGDALYELARAIPWGEHLDVSGRFAVHCAAPSPPAWLRNSQYAALRVKDAIVDRFRDHVGRRPDVDRDDPDLRVRVRVRGDEVRIGLDLSPGGLHRRGYRAPGEQVEAPLRENLAAAILLAAGWPELAARGAPLCDPMCGSGTLVIEAALVAGDIAPGLCGAATGPSRWRGHDAALWRRLVDEARERAASGRSQLLVDGAPRLFARDRDPRALRMARDNLERAGLTPFVVIERGELTDWSPPREGPGLVVTNPPYGARMGERDDSLAIYEQLGARLRGFVGWRAAVLTGASEHARALGHRPEARRELANGPLQCELLTFTIVEEPAVALPEDLVGRLRKNLKTLGRWARRAGVTCYRIYDADIPSYAIAVDVHETDAGRCLHIHEYAAPSSIDPDKARARLDAAVAAAAAVLEVPWPRVFVKQRRRQRKGEQYERIAEEGSRFVVREGPCRLLVNFTDHLDTGLYLDHRDTRALIGELAAGRDFLNLFAYTATASVHAALGGARSTTSVDRSNTYCDWALDNLALNGLDADRHRVIRADVDAFLRTERRRYGLVFVDTPTFSNARHTPDTFDVQRDHVALLRAVARLLTRDGVIVFSTHARRFELDSEALADLPLVVTDITRETIPRDFARAPRIHRCYRFDPRP